MGISDIGEILIFPNWFVDPMYPNPHQNFSKIFLEISKLIIKFYM
jgi:hypothetical protein